MSIGEKFGAILSTGATNAEYDLKAAKHEESDILQRIAEISSRIQNLQHNSSSLTLQDELHSLQFKKQILERDLEFLRKKAKLTQEHESALRSIAQSIGGSPSEEPLKPDAKSSSNNNNAEESLTLGGGGLKLGGGELMQSLRKSTLGGSLK